MSHSGADADDGYTVRYVRRDGVWVAEVSRGGDFWRLFAEWGGLTLAACAIVTMGPIVGYLSAKPALDAESPAVAEAAARQALKVAAVDETCSGRTHLAPFSAYGLITARYLCQAKLGGRDALAALSMRDEPDSWKLTGFYVQRTTQ